MKQNNQVINTLIKSYSKERYQYLFMKNVDVKEKKQDEINIINKAHDKRRSCH